MVGRGQAAIVLDGATTSDHLLLTWAHVIPLYVRPSRSLLYSADPTSLRCASNAHYNSHAGRVGGNVHTRRVRHCRARDDSGSVCPDAPVHPKRR